MGMKGQWMRQQVHKNCERDGCIWREAKRNLLRKGTEVKVQRVTRRRTRLIPFPSSSSSFHIVSFLLCTSEERDPLPLLFIQECGTSWQAGFSLTVHSWEFPLWLFLLTPPVLCVCVCFYSIICIIRRPGLTQIDSALGNESLETEPKMTGKHSSRHRGKVSFLKS